MQLLVDEKAVLMVEKPKSWPTGAPEVKDTGRIEGCGSVVAKERFLEEFGELG